MTRRAATSEIVAGDEPSARTDAAAGGAQRVDKWLWYVRLVKSRTQAAGLVEAGKVRVNRARVVKPSATVAAGDVVTIAADEKVRVLKVLAPGTRRGPASEAQALYEDLTPALPKATDAPALGSAAGTDAIRRDAGSGRPTKRDRRHLDRLRGRDDET